MKTILTVLQFISALGLIIAVLLHSAKGEGLGGIGGSAKLFGSPKGLEEGLDRITIAFAAGFILISIVIAIGG